MYIINKSIKEALDFLTDAIPQYVGVLVYLDNTIIDI